MCLDREIGGDGALLFVLRPLLTGKRKQGQAKGTNPQENPVESGLVPEKTGKQGRAICLLHNLYSLEPCLPGWAEMPFDPNVILHALACSFEKTPAENSIPVSRTRTQ